MITENLSTLKIHRLTQSQYNRELEAGNIDKNALYLTPENDNEIYDKIYPVGSVWVGGKRDGKPIDPATIFGGEWELFDKGFKPIWSAALPNFESLCNYTIDYYQSGNIVKVLVNVTLRLSVLKSTKLLTLNFGRMGLDLNIPASVGVIEPSVLTNVNTIVKDTSASHTAFANVEVKRNGEVFVTPISFEHAPMTLSADSTFDFEVIIPAAPEQMLDEFCDKFYWERTM